VETVRYVHGYSFNLRYGGTGGQRRPRERAGRKSRPSDGDTVCTTPCTVITTFDQIELELCGEMDLINTEVEYHNIEVLGSLHVDHLTTVDASGFK
jgi:hypothetical protein